MLSHGAAALSNSELLAVLLRTGTPGNNVMEICRMLLNSCDGSLVALSRMGEKQLCTFPGIQSSKAATIMAVFELGRRFVQETVTQQTKRTVTCARDAYDAMIPILKGLDHEEALIILLDKAHRITDHLRLGVGSFDAVSVNPRQVAKTALEKGAESIILVHNHPSGQPVPSKADIRLTEAVHKTCTLCDISLLDHIIICDNCFYSFADEKVIDL